MECGYCEGDGEVCGNCGEISYSCTCEEEDGGYDPVICNHCEGTGVEQW